ncbi:MAG TPA: cation diffusion facilitator family transporter, partial [Gemmatimonadaceae bacterium]
MGHSHDHHHGHSHGHGHTHGPVYGAGAAASTRALKWSLVLTVVILIAEGVGGWVSNSLALLADAGHVLTDAGALALSLFVAWLARQPGSGAKTFGYLRWEILAALINGATLLLISAWIVIEAIGRFKAPQPVSGGIMLGVAILGFVVNGVAVWLLHGVREGSLNVRGAYLHVLGDMLASGGTVIAGAIIHYTGWLGADPIASLLTTLLIVAGSWRLVRESVDVLLESAPPHIALDAVRT